MDSGISKGVLSRTCTTQTPTGESSLDSEKTHLRERPSCAKSCSLATVFVGRRRNIQFNRPVTEWRRRLMAALLMPSRHLREIFDETAISHAQDKEQCWSQFTQKKRWKGLLDDWSECHLGVHWTLRWKRFLSPPSPLLSACIFLLHLMEFCFLTTMKNNFLSWQHKTMPLILRCFFQRNMSPNRHFALRSVQHNWYSPQRDSSRWYNFILFLRFQIIRFCFFPFLFDQHRYGPN